MTRGGVARDDALDDPEADPLCSAYDGVIAARGTSAVSAERDVELGRHLEGCARCRDLARLFESEDDDEDDAEHAVDDPLGGPPMGTVLAGRYRLDRRLGSGGMGVVWSATQVATGQTVAIKLLRDTGSARSRRRLVREARLAASVQHPNVVRIYDVIELEDGAPAIVMELLAGESLQRRFEAGPLALGELCRILERVAAALEAAHEAGIVHRDLKPPNVLLVPGVDGATEVKLVDFGIAKQTAPLADGTTGSLTSTGALVGTPFYMSPEQALGEADVDRRTDLWSLGIMLYQGLSGVLPTRGDNLGQVIKAIALVPIEPIEARVSGLPDEVAALTRRLLAKNHEDRPTAREARGVFGRWSGARAPDAIGAVASARLRRRAGAAVGLALVGLAAAFAFAFASRDAGRSGSQTAPREASERPDMERRLDDPPADVAAVAEPLAETASPEGAPASTASEDAAVSVGLAPVRPPPRSDLAAPSRSRSAVDRRSESTDGPARRARVLTVHRSRRRGLGGRASSATAWLLVLLLHAAAPARAAQPAPGDASAAEANQARAKALFTRGLALLDAGDVERALEAFLASRGLEPGKGNTANAAHCLERLGRYDEALELYEELVVRFAGELSAENRERLGPAIATLRSRVGGVVVTANVDGVLVVDGRARGRLPLASAVRVLPGRHLLRVFKDGYETAERTVAVAVSETTGVDVILRPLANAGRLRLEVLAGAAADVVVDDVGFGPAPWEGTLGPGSHVVSIAAKDCGSAPTRAIVVQGQTATVSLRCSPLGPAVRIAVVPSSAELVLDGVSLGAPTWAGRLPEGKHEAAGVEPGYVARTVAFDEPGPGGVGGEIKVVLAVDPDHPRWPRRPAGRVRLAVDFGLAVAPSIGSDAEHGCSTSCGPALGVVARGRAGYAFPMGLELDVVAGYLSIEDAFGRTRSTSFTSLGARRAVTYGFADRVRLRGPLFGASAGWSTNVSSRLALVSRLTAGVLDAFSTDPLTGTASSGSATVPLVVTTRGEQLTSVDPFVLPEVGIDVQWGRATFGVGVGLLALLGGGARFGHDLVEVNPAGCSRAHPGSPACAPASPVVASERAYGPAGAWVPSLAVGYTL